MCELHFIELALDFLDPYSPHLSPTLWSQRLACLRGGDRGSGLAATIKKDLDTKFQVIFWLSYLGEMFQSPGSLPWCLHHRHMADPGQFQ
jgi:hypothetical protein